MIWYTKEIGYWQITALIWSEVLSKLQKCVGFLKSCTHCTSSLVYIIYFLNILVIILLWYFATDIESMLEHHSETCTENPVAQGHPVAA